MSKTKEFMLGAVKWTILMDNNEMADVNALGMTYPNEAVVRLADFHKGKSIPKDLVEQTLYHEVVHAILGTMGYNELFEDEEFVQGFSLLLHQFETTKINQNKEDE